MEERRLRRYHIEDEFVYLLINVMVVQDSLILFLD